MNLDFTSAKLKHGSWKLKLRDFLDGKPGLTPAQATSHKDCDLGKWMYAPTVGGIAKYGNVPEMKALESEHTKLHATIKTIMSLKQAGNAAGAEAEFAKVEPISKKIIELLNAVEAHVKRDEQRKAA